MKTALTLVLPILSVGLIYSGEAAPADGINLGEGSSMGDLAPGSELIVGENAIILPADTEYIYFQQGSFNQHVYKDETYCGLKLRGTTGHVRRLAPGRKLTITGTSEGKELHFGLDPAVEKLWCTAPAGYRVDMGTFKFETRVLFKIVPAQIPDA